MLTPNPKAEATALLDQYWLDKPMPVDPVAIARRLGVQVFKGTLPDDIAGVLTKRVGHDPRIVVQCTDTRSRRRFMVAYELGHFVYQGAVTQANKDEYEYVDRRLPLSQTGAQPSENFAKGFAAELLMPGSVVDLAAARMQNATAALAGQFGVSQEALSYRLRKLKSI